MEIKVLNLEFSDIAVGFLYQLDVIFNECFRILAFSEEIFSFKNIFLFLNIDIFSEMIWNSLKYLLNGWICTNEIVIDEYSDVFLQNGKLNGNFMNFFNGAEKFYQIGHLRRLFNLSIVVDEIDSFTQFPSHILRNHSIISSKCFELMKKRYEHLWFLVKKFAFFSHSFQLVFTLDLPRNADIDSFNTLLLNSIINYLDLEMGSVNNVLISVKNNFDSKQSCNIPSNF